MNTAAIILIEYAWMVAWWLFTLLTGAALITLFKRHWDHAEFRAPNRELGLFFSLAAGLAVQIAALTVIAQAGALSPAPVLGVFATLGLVSAWMLARSWQGSWLAGIVAPLSLDGLLAALPLALLLLAWLLRPLGPAMAHDEVSYHLPYARFYVEQGGLAVQEYLRFPLHSHNFNLLYALALMRDSVAMAHLFHASAGFVTLIGLHGLARLWYGAGGAFVAVVLLLLVGVLQMGFGNAFVDLGLMLFVTAAMFALAMWQERRKPSWLILGAIFLGMAMGTKYLGVLFTLPLGLWVLSIDRKPSDLFRFALVACACGLFWYVRSWLISGNPVHPFLGEWFGYYIWSSRDVGDQMSSLARHGIDKTLFNFLSLPVQLLIHKSQFHGYSYLDGVLLGGFMAGLFNMRRMRPAMRVLALIALLYLVFWFTSSHVLRYLLPVAPVMALVGGLLARDSANALLGYARKLALPALPRIRGWLRSASARVKSLALPAPWSGGAWRPATRMLLRNRASLVMILLAAAFCINRIGEDLRTVPITASRQDAYLRKNKDGYELLLAAAAHPRIGAGPLLQFRLEGSFYYFPGTLYGDWTGHHAYTQYMEINEAGVWQILPPAQVLAMMRERGIRGVVFFKDPIGMFYPPDPEAWAPLFDTVFDNGYGTVMVPR